VPAAGRVYQGQRRVRLGDASPGGRLRFDALVRYLQDVANDDTRDAGFDDVMGWVVRRTEIEVRQFPVYLEPIALSTWCSGVGGRWAERRVHVVGEGGGHVEAATLWVHLDPDTMRPKVLPESFHALFGPSALGRTVRARRQHAEAPEDEGLVTARHTFPLRFTDFDVLNHVNNAVYWEAVEEELARPEFAVKVLEARLPDVKVGPLRLSVRVDRVDETAGGEWLREAATGTGTPPPPSKHHRAPEARRRSHRDFQFREPSTSVDIHRSTSIRRPSPELRRGALTPLCHTSRLSVRTGCRLLVPDPVRPPGTRRAQRSGERRTTQSQSTTYSNRPSTEVTLAWPARRRCSRWA
jgi:acyl-ACP thioesterase